MEVTRTPINTMHRTRVREQAEATVTIVPEEDHEDYSRILQERARRCLFAPVNRDKVNRDLHSALQALEDIVDEKSKRWNFDFENSTPLPGPLQWTLVSSCDQEDVEEDGSVVEVIQTKLGNRGSPKEASSVTPSRLVKQRSIEDFFPRGKRTSSSTDMTGAKRKAPDSTSAVPSLKVGKVVAKK
ncbi:hypothetical protein RvY_17688 [Ramazzottius varieornatus]|uniref:Cyclin-dependent kinase inhibitor domain-containing protein n=1 Tax=Ramazzottius varieornatus TaxID=947166 RepID=A0A1D1W6T0_RAMVA|nr:hypothetical protein RvY_17688 [Ramazzottius varieornatus]